MTNFYLRTKSIEKGAATLLFAVVLIVLSTLIIIFAANFGRTQDQIVANQHRNNQAFQAAEAGMEFAINYLQKNLSTIIAFPANGFINYSDSSTTNIALPNGSKFSAVYTNPTANNYDLILITSTGVSDDGSSSHVVIQLVQKGIFLPTPGTRTLTSKGTVFLDTGTIIKNIITNQNVQAGSTVTFNGTAISVTSTGTTSSSSGIGPDVQQNSGAISSESQADFFTTYFDSNTDILKGEVDHYYTNSSNTDYSATLNNFVGTSIWIDQATGTTATINGATTIGSSTNPVILVVNGNLSLTGGVTIYGFVFVTGTTTMTIPNGKNNITGGFVSAGNVNLTGTTITYDATVLSNLQTNPAMRYFAKVPGSWKDF